MLIFLLLVVIGSQRARGQEPLSTPPASVRPGVLESAPLDTAHRAGLIEAMQARDYKRAEKLLVEAIERNPKAGELLKLLGGVFFLDGKYSNSAITMKKAEALNALDDPNRFTLAMSYILLERRDGARIELEKLAQTDPRNALYPYWLARLDYDDQHFAAGVEKLKLAVELDPDFMKAYDNMGLCLEALGKLDEAVASYERANHLNRRQKPGSPWPPLNLGILLLRMGRYREAEDYLRESVGYNSRFPQAHYQLGVLLEKKGQYAEAIGELKQAVTFDSTYPEPHYALARIYRRRGDSENAAKALHTFQQLKKQKRPQRTQ